MNWLIVVMAIVAALLLLYIGGAVSRADRPETPVPATTGECNMAALGRARFRWARPNWHHHALLVEHYRTAWLAPVVPIGQPIPAALGRAA